MSQYVRYLGSYSIGGMFPTLVSFFAGVIPRLRAQAAGAARLSAQMQVTLPSIDARINAAARIQAALAVTPPGVRFSVAANAQLYALLQAQLKIIFDLQSALGSAGVEAFVFDGPAGPTSSEILAALAGGLPGGSSSQHISGFVFGTRFPETFAAMGKVFFA